MTDATILPFPGPNRRHVPRDVLGRVLEREQARLASRPAVFDAAVDTLAFAMSTAEAGLDLAALGALRASLFVSPGREPEMQQIWRESLATAAIAGLIADPLQLDRRALTRAALLHRLDEVLFVAAVARAEVATGLRLRGPALRRAYSERDALLEDLLGAWQLDPGVVSAVRQWRSCPDPSTGDEGFDLGRGVYYAHLLAMTRLYPEEGVPGILELATRELRVPDAVPAMLCAAAVDMGRVFARLSGI